MVHLYFSSNPTLDRTLSAVADPTRRTILARLGQGEASISALAEPLGITLTGVKKHVAVLEEAGLVTTQKVGRERRCRLAAADPLDTITQWVEQHRRSLEARLDRFEQLLEREQRKGRTS